MSPSVNNKKQEYQRKIKSLNEHENEYTRRASIINFKSVEKEDIVYVQDNELIGIQVYVQDNELIGIQNKINKCRKSLNLPLIKDCPFPNCQLPSFMKNVILNKNLPVKLRKALEHAPTKRNDNKFWNCEKKLIHSI